jgi:glycosyltransferase involved in cell wall biosynthesis
VLHAKLSYRPDAARGKLRYILETIKAAQGHFDLVVCGHINLLPLAVAINSQLNAPLVLLVYGIDVWQLHHSLLVRKLINKVSKVWSISEITRDKMRAWAHIAESKFAILPNAIDLGYYGVGPKNPEMLRRYQLEGRKVILLLARLVGWERYKGVDEILEIMPNLLRRVPNLTFLVAGDGNDRSRLEEKAKILGVQNSVVFTGFVQETEKRDLFRLADLFVMPGRGEGFGFVFLEALACGVPVVASCLDGSREAIRNGKLGRLVDPRDAVELEAAIVEGLNDPHGVPEGLSYFAFPQFQERLAKAVHEALNK